MAVCYHREFHDPEKHVKLPVVFESKLSTKLGNIQNFFYFVEHTDPDEFVLFQPAIGEGSFGAVYRGQWRGEEVEKLVFPPNFQRSQSNY